MNSNIWKRSIALGAVMVMILVGTAAGVSLAASDDLPYLGPEIIVSALENEQYLPAVAYNSVHREFLVVWHNNWGGNRDIYAQRISENGELLSWFAVCAGGNDCAQPDVAYDPVHDRYLVVWIYDTNGNGSNWDVQGRFIPWNGPSTSLDAFDISIFPTHQWTPRVAFGQTQGEFLVVWNNEYQDGSLPMYISGRRVFADGNGMPTGDSAFSIFDGVEERVNVDVAYNLARNEYLVVYDNAEDILATRFRGDGVALGTGEFNIAAWPDSEIRPAVAACRAADQYLVTWQSYRVSDYDLFARPVLGDGSLNSTVHTISEFAGQQENSDVACDQSGQNYFISWREDIISGGISGMIAGSDGTLNTGFQIAAPGVSPGHEQPAVAGGHTNYLVVWQHQLDATYIDIHGRLIIPHVLFLPMILK